MELRAAVVTAGWVVAPEPEDGHPTPAANSMLAPPTIAMGTTATAVTSSAPTPIATSTASRPALKLKRQLTYSPPRPARCR